jgi:hypothetical protein
MRGELNRQFSQVRKGGLYIVELSRPKDQVEVLDVVGMLFHQRHDTVEISAQGERKREASGPIEPDLEKCVEILGVPVVGVDGGP